MLIVGNDDGVFIKIIIGFFVVTYWGIILFPIVYKEMKMTIHNVKSYYITSKSSSRMIRYDLIRVGGGDYLVKVFDEQSEGVSYPRLIAQIGEFKITDESYQKEKKVQGRQSSVKMDLTPEQSYEGYVQSILQQHRNEID